MVELSIQILLLPAPVLAVVVPSRAKGRLTILLQEGLSKRTVAAVLAEALDDEVKGRQRVRA